MTWKEENDGLKRLIERRGEEKLRDALKKKKKKEVEGKPKGEVLEKAFDFKGANKLSSFEVLRLDNGKPNKELLDLWGVEGEEIYNGLIRVAAVDFEGSPTSICCLTVVKTGSKDKKTVVVPIMNIDEYQQVTEFLCYLKAIDKRTDVLAWGGNEKTLLSVDEKATNVLEIIDVQTVYDRHFKSKEISHETSLVCAYNDRITAPRGEKPWVKNKDAVELWGKMDSIFELLFPRSDLAEVLQQKAPKTTLIDVGVADTWAIIELWDSMKDELPKGM